MKNSKLSTDPYKGVRDFYPEDMFYQKHIFSVMKKTVESFGYEEYSASVLEPTDIYRAKSGDEIVNEQTYNFKDRGERDVTLRPEMTPTVARMVAAKKREFSFPLRWYSIPNLFRYEQPQRGRVREHWQLNVDLFGSDSVEADVEIISVAYQIMKNLGAKNSDFEIRVNDRQSLLKGLREKKLSSEQTSKIIRLLDKKDKMSPEDFKVSAKKILDDSLELEFEQSENTKAVLASLKNLGIKNAVLAPNLVRGFDYYTGMVFEVYDSNPENKRALFGGGRYDNLTEIFGGEKVPAVGFGMGDVTAKDFLETHGLLPKYKSETDLYICKTDEKFSSESEVLASDLRNQKLNVAVDISSKKVGDQIKTAVKKSIPFIVCIGEDEIKSGKFKVKELATSKETELDRAKISEFIRNSN